MLNYQSTFQKSNLPFNQITPDTLANLRRLREAREERQKRLVEARDKYKNLSSFVQDAWKVLVPNATLKWGWACDAICDHLAAVTKGDIKRLIINIAPRHGKSSIVSICWPAWTWLYQPSLRWLFASYDLSLSTDLSVDCRRIIESYWYKEECLPDFVLTTDQNVKSHFDNSKQGSRIATAMIATAAGMGGDIVVADDPHNRIDANSQTKIESAINGWRYGISVCLNDKIDGPLVVIGQRVCAGDLTDHLLEEGGWELLCLPTEFDSVKRSTSLGYYDKRTKDKELLFPERFDEKANQEAKKSLLVDGYSSQHGQNPTPSTGVLFDVDKFKHIEQSEIDAIYDELRKHRHWDMAATVAEAGKEPAWTCGVQMGIHKDDGRIIILDVERLRQDPAGVEAKIKETAERDGLTTSISTEEEKGSAGKHVGSLYARKVLQGYIFHSQPIKGDKLTRARAFAAQVNAGNVYANKKAAYWFEYSKEMKKWPRTRFKDQGDGSSGAYNELVFSPYYKLDLPPENHEVNDLYEQ